MAGMPENEVSAIVTDPPYGLEFSTKELDEGSSNKAHRHAQFSRSGSGLPRYGSWAPTASKKGIESLLKQRKLLQSWHEKWLKEAYRVLKPGGWLLAFASTTTHHRLAVAAENRGFEVRDLVVWLQGQGWPKSQASLRPNIEPVLVARKPFSEYGVKANKAKWGVGDLNRDFCRSEIERTPSNVVLGEDAQVALGEKAAFFYTAKVGKKEKTGHPTQKPVAIFTYLLSLIASPEDAKDHSILDPFCGSGTCGVAAARLGFQWQGIDQDARWTKITQERLQGE